MQKTLFFDLHTDILTANKGVNLLLNEALNNQKLGYKSINAIYKGDLSFKKAINLAKLAKTRGLLVAFEDCSYNEFVGKDDGNNFSSERLLCLANSLLEFCPLYISLCWNNQNAFASGCRAKGGLTNTGRAFLKILNDKNAVVDTAHANQKSFYDICENANKVICSHTAFYSIFPHKRNITKEQIKEIISKNGIIGLLTVGHFLTGAKKSISAYENAFYEHIDWFLQNFGAKNLCIATDFYGSDFFVFKNGDYSFVNRLIQVLSKRGVSNSDINAILYKNAVDYFKMV